MGMSERKAKAAVVFWKTTAKNGLDVTARKTIRSMLKTFIGSYNYATKEMGLHTTLRVRWEW